MPKLRRTFKRTLRSTAGVPRLHRHDPLKKGDRVKLSDRPAKYPLFNGWVKPVVVEAPKKK
jgi:hypothetical protein